MHAQNDGHIHFRSRNQAHQKVLAEHSLRMSPSAIKHESANSVSLSIESPAKSLAEHVFLLAVLTESSRQFRCMMPCICLLQMHTEMLQQS